MVGHENLMPGVARTDYANGISIYVNYNRQPVTVDGITIDARGYSVIGGGL
jgi:hypothetical protein